MTPQCLPRLHLLIIFLSCNQLGQGSVKGDEYRMDDEVLIQRVLQGKTEAFTQLVERYKDFAYSIALNVLLVPQDAEETAHDSFLKVYKNLNKFNHEAKFSTWLYRIVFNTAVTRKRKKRIEQTDIEKAFNLGHSDRSVLEDEDQQKFIKFALAGLSEDDRALLMLYYLKEHTMEEVAEITGLDKKLIKVKMFRARNRMAKELKKILNKEALNL